MRKKFLTSVLACGIIVSMGSNVFADSLQDKLNSTKDQYNQSQANLSSAQKNALQLEGQIEQMDNEIENEMSQVSTLNGKISETQSNIAVTEKAIQDSEAQIKKEKQLYNARMKAMYINGVSGYIEVIFDSSNISDFLSKAEIVDRVTQADNKIITDLNNKEAKLQSDKDKLAADQSSLISMKKSSSDKVAQLSKNEEAEKPLVAQAQSQVSVLTDVTASQQAEINQITQQVNSQKAAAAAQAQQVAYSGKTTTTTTTNSSQAVSQGNSSKNSGSGGSSVPNNNNGSGNKSLPSAPATPSVPTPSVPAAGSASAQNIINYAESFLGVPYLYGGKTPAGFDCSGFTSYVFGHFGVGVSGRSEDQWHEGKAVNPSNLQPGDLVFFYMQSDGPEHVAIYIGNGLMIEAPHTGANVRIVSFTNYPSFCGARRVL